MLWTHYWIDSSVFISYFVFGSVVLISVSIMKKNIYIYIYIYIIYRIKLNLLHAVTLNKKSIVLLTKIVCHLDGILLNFWAEPGQHSLWQ